MKKLPCAALLSVCGLLVLGLSALVPPAEAQQGSLWVAHSGGVAELDRGSGLVVQQVTGTTDGRAVAVDTARGVVWYAANDRVGQVTLAGSAAGSFPVSLGSGEEVRLAVDPLDGHPWVAADGRVRSFSAVGIQLQDLPLGGAVVGLAFGGPGGRVWAATEDVVVGLNRSTGFEEVRLDPEDPILALTLDAAQGMLWVALQGELRRYSTSAPEEEDPLVRLPEVGLTQLLPDGLGGLWAVREGALVRYDADGEVLATAAPFAPPRQAQQLAGDAATVSLWSTDGESLVRTTAAGFEQERYVLGAGLEIRDQSAVSEAPESDPPLLSFVEPAAQAVLEEDSPAILLAWADAGSGVDPETLVLTLDGGPLEVVCASSLTGAACAPDVYLDQGPHTLTASVQDHLANAAVPASVSFTVDLYSGDPVWNPDPNPGGGSGGPAPYQPIAVDRGVGTNAVYLGDEAIETISPASGNLSLTIPLGQTYSVGPMLSYSFQAVHNSSIWQRAELSCSLAGVSCPAGGSSVAFSVPNPASNAGLGWEMHFGRLFPVQPPAGLSGLDLELWPTRGLVQSNPRAKWLYVAPDGASHVLGQLTNRPGDTSVSYSLDGTHLRLRKVSEDRVEVDLPNGVVAAFERTGDLDGTLFCSGGLTGCWRLLEQEDPYGNRMWMEYPGASSGIETWEVHDSVGRVHFLHFDRSADFRAGGDGAGIDRRANDDELGDVRRLLTQVDLQAFGGQRAVYGFEYTAPVEVSRGGYFDGSAVSQSAQRLRTRLLLRIVVPGIQPWVFTTSSLGDPGIGQGQGEVNEVKLPSRGRLEYLYGNWSFPSRCDYSPGEPAILPPVTYQQLGVVRKRRLRPGGAEEGRWVYLSSLGGGEPWESHGQNCSLARWRRTEIRGPKVGGTYDRQDFYHAVAEGPRLPSSTNPLTSWQVTDHGLPYTKDVSVTDSGGQKVFLSREVYQCPAPPDQTCTAVHKKRSVYLRYASEWTGICAKIAGNGPECWRLNPSRVVERTVYHDDANRWVERRFEDQNGFGAARLTKTLSSFSEPYEEQVSYTVGHSGLSVNSFGYFQVGTPSSWTPAVTALWILHPYSYKILMDGELSYRTDYEFNTQGTLTCERQRRLFSGRKPQDLVTRFTLGMVVGVNAGLPVTEEHFGGDQGALSTALCSTVGNSSNGTKYTIEHTYQALVRSTSRVGGSDFPYTYQATIDPSTGLPSATYDVADQPTTLTYDVLGRLLQASPAAALGEAKTVLTHHSPAAANPWVEIARKDGATVLTSSILEFDAFGRSFETRLRRPLAGGGFAWSKQQTQYDPAGRVTVETTLQNDGAHTTLNRTRYTQFDAFGRATRISAPDRQEIRMFHFGDRKVERRAHVATSDTATEQVITSVVHDALGRVVEEVNPLYRTTYDRDAYGQVVRAVRIAGGATQVRTYGWDGRGFLTSETLPEIGADGSAPGTVGYDYDALGNLRERRDGRVTLTTDYDLAGRPVLQKEGTRIWQEWVWGGNNVGSGLGANLRHGKLEIAKRHNYPGAGTDHDWMISETYEYRGRLGQVSSRITKLEFPTNPPGQQVGDVFATGWTYDALGNRTTLSYPRCTAPVCTDPGDSPGPAHTLSYAYTSGILTSVSSSLGPSASYQFHPNLELSQADYSNGIRTQWSQEAHGMTRPQRIRVSRSGGGMLFDTGTYAYDPSGNIKAIGSERYVYDRASRLTKGTVARATGVQQQYTYDGFDNVTGSRQDSDPWQVYQIDAKNRYRTGVAAPAPLDVFYDVAGNLVRAGVRPDGGILREWQYDGLGSVSSFIYHAYDQTTGAVTPNPYLQIYGPGNYRFLTFDPVRLLREYTLRDLSGKVLRLWEVAGWGDYQSPTSPGQQMTFIKDYLYGAEGMFGSWGAGGARRFFHTDHLGSPRITTGDDGARQDALLGRRYYLPYGADVSYAGQYDDRICKFTGHERDVHGTTDYMMARSYAFSIQRFTSPDPGRDGWNLYAYAGNNPIRYVDPDGESFVDFAKGFGKGLVTGLAVGAVAAAAVAVGPVAAAAVITAGVISVATVAVESYAVAVDPMATAAEKHEFAGEVTGAFVGAGAGYKVAGKALAARGGGGATRSPTMESLLRSSRQPDRNGLTRAGRALQKHGDRAGSVFPKASGTAAARNAQADKVLGELLESSNKASRPNRFGGEDYFDVNTGRGARFGKDGEFITFLDP